jgi:hypothetical protein
MSTRIQPISLRKGNAMKLDSLENLFIGSLAESVGEKRCLNEGEECSGSAIAAVVSGVHADQGGSLPPLDPG